MNALTIKQRLTLWFTAAFLLSGSVVQTIVFWRLDRRLTTELDGSGIESLDLGLPEGLTPRQPEDILLPDGRTFAEVLRAVQDDYRSDTLTELTLVSGVALATTAVLAVVVGRWLAERALRPIERITDTTNRINAASLDTRLDWAGPRDEVAELAATVDAMLQRIDDGVAAQRQFAAMASHELLTPLASIELESDLAIADPASTTVDQLAERTGSGARRAGELVVKLLELSKGQAGLRHRSRFELWEAVDAALEPQLENATTSGLRVDFEPGSGTVNGDRTLLTSMSRNLLQNAIRHNCASGSVVVRVSEDEGRVHLVVENTGPRVDGELLERVRQPFQRGIDNPQDIGHGLGLSIVRTIVDHHDGELEMTARAEGGMRVQVMLPAA